MLHVLPTNDIREHTESSKCDCCPQVIRQEGSEDICVHNSYDGREYVEALTENVNEN